LNLLPEDFGLTMRRRPKHGARTGVRDNEAQS
jgi:hypothetical protein